MKILLIVGNGFDCAHDVKSKYVDFKEYLEETYTSTAYPLLETYQDNNGGIFMSSENAVSILFNHLDSLLDDGKWGTFEDDLAYFDFEEYIGSMDFYFSDNDDSSDFRYQYMIEDFDDIVYHLYERINDLFLEWISSLSVAIDFKTKEPIQELLNKEDLKVLSFNYTMFIEEYYGKSDVIHIHNCIHDNQIIIGHGEQVEKPDMIFSVKGINTNMRSHFKKKTDDNIRNHIDFFNEIDQNTKEVYSYGFSFSKPDIPYIEYIINKLSDDCTWYLNAYKLSEAEEQKDLLLRLGFKGEIKFY